MPNVTLGALIDAVGDTLFTATGMRRLESYDELTEGIQPADLPLLQVYLESIQPVATGSSTDRTTFRGGGRHKTFTIYADLHAKQRGPSIAEEMAAAIDMCGAIVDVLEQQNTKPYFGEDAIKSFSWDAVRSQFQYANLLTMGFRFTITLHVY